jgi:hypothetical protein
MACVQSADEDTTKREDDNKTEETKVTEEAERWWENTKAEKTVKKVEEERKNKLKIRLTGGIIIMRERNERR